MVLTNNQIAEYLSDLDYPVPIRVYDTPQAEQKRKFPSIEINNIVPTDETENWQTKREQQRFEVHVYMRIKSFESDETNRLGQIEDLIKTELDGVQLAGSKIILENKTWNRQPIQKPVFYYNSVLTVLAVDMEAVEGILGLQQTLDIGSLLGLQLFGETGTQGRSTFRRSNDTGHTKLNMGERSGDRFWEFAYTKARWDAIAALIDTGDTITATLHQTGQADEIITGKPVFQRPNTRYDGQKVITLEFQVE